MQRRGLVLLATMSESDTIEAVLQEVAESVTQLQRFGWVFEVLVVDDVIGVFDLFKPKFVKRYAEVGAATKKAVAAYAADVRAGRFPALEHCFTDTPQKAAAKKKPRK